MIVQETTEYKDDNVQISGNQVRFGDMTYQTSDIKSVAIDTEIKRHEMYNRSWFKLIQAVALVVLVFSLLNLIFDYLPPDTEDIMGYISFLVVAINFALTWLPNWKGEKTYKVVLKGTFGKVDAVSSKDGDYAVIIANTVRSAIKRQVTK